MQLEESIPGMYGTGAYAAVPKNLDLKGILSAHELLKGRFFPYFSPFPGVTGYKTLFELQEHFAELTVTYSLESNFDSGFFWLPAKSLEGYYCLHINVKSTLPAFGEMLIGGILELLPDKTELDLNEDIKGYLEKLLLQDLTFFKAGTGLLEKHKEIKKSLCGEALPGYRMIKQGPLPETALGYLKEQGFSSMPENCDFKLVNRYGKKLNGREAEASILYLSGEELMPRACGAVLATKDFLEHSEGNKLLCRPGSAVGYLFSPQLVFAAAAGVEPKASFRKKLGNFSHTAVMVAASLAPMRLEAMIDGLSSESNICEGQQWEMKMLAQAVGVIGRSARAN